MAKHCVYLSLGSNQGDRKVLLEEAIRLLGIEAGRVEQVADYIETKPWGFASSSNFLNTAVRLSTDLDPHSLLDLSQELERRLGREHKTSSGGGYQDRPIDIDLLFYDDLVYTSDRLTIPHPHVGERRFVLEPLASIAPDLRHPESGRTIANLLESLDD